MKTQPARVFAEIIERVQKGEAPPLRPDVPRNPPDASPAAVPLLSHCWEEAPELRPDFTEIKKTIRSFNKGK